MQIGSKGFWFQQALHRYNIILKRVSGTVSDGYFTQNIITYMSSQTHKLLFLSYKIIKTCINYEMAFIFKNPNMKPTQRNKGYKANLTLYTYISYKLWSWAAIRFGAIIKYYTFLRPHCKFICGLCKYQFLVQLIVDELEFYMGRLSIL